MKILKVTDAAFGRYGRVVENVDFSGLVEELKETPVPADVVYEPSVEALEALPVMEELSRVVYGEMPIQIGYCNGHNTKLNALEYHRDSEINVAAKDAVLMLGLLADVEARRDRGGDLCNHPALCALPCHGGGIPGGHRSAERDELSLEEQPQESGGGSLRRGRHG